MPCEVLNNPEVCLEGRSATREPEPAPEPAISVRDLGKCYRIYSRPQDRLKQAVFRGRRHYFREFWALRDISLEVQRGETVGIMGRNGCGKSTLLQVICGTLKPTTGRIQINGRIAALLELGAGLNPEFTGRDNIYTKAAILGLSREEIDARYDQIVAFSELGEFIDQPVKIYSSGMYVRLAFAVASTIEPDILVVDEALAVGDEAFQRKCFARIEAIKKRGGTILFVSHAASTVVELCDRAVLLERGERLLTGQPKTVAKMYQKLLYARGDAIPSVRAEIQRLDENPQLEAAESETAQPPAPQPEKRPDPADRPSDPAYFQPGLEPKSTVVYQVNGAEIIDPHIATPDGRRVNVLAPRRDYLIKYRVRFVEPALRVLWGTMLKSIRGVEIAGKRGPEHCRDYVPAGSEVQVAFRFRCTLTTGVYFANVGVFGTVNGKEGYLHRIVDGLMFRVLCDNKQTKHGFVDCFLDCNSEITLLDGSPEEARVKGPSAA